MTDGINSRIKKYRKQAGLTQAEVADKLNMKRSTYSAREATGTPDAEFLKQLSDVFGVPVSWLLYDKENLNHPVETANTGEKPNVLGNNGFDFDDEALLITGKERLRLQKLRRISASNPEFEKLIDSIIDDFHKNISK